MIIDAHSHGLHGKSIDRLVQAGGDWAERIINPIRERARKHPASLDVASRVATINNYGIDFQVVTPIVFLDVNLFPGDANARLAVTREMNDSMARMMDDSQGKLITIGTIPLADFGENSAREMERAVRTLGLKGINIVSNIGGRPIDSPEFESFWAKAAELDIPIYIHPIRPISQNDRCYEAKYDLTHNFGWPFETVLALSSIVFSGLMDRYPGLKIVSHHLGGGMVPFFWGRILETYEPSKQSRLLGKVMPKPLFDYFSRFYYDTAVGGSASAIKCAYEVFGAGQLVFASDMNSHGKEKRLATYPGVIRSLGLSKDETEKIFAGNARRMLKLD